MKISILTLFPEMFEGPFGYSIVKKALEKKLVTIELVNIRDFGIGRHKTVDDTPYGGGTGMIMRVDVVDKAIKSVASKEIKQRIVLLDAKGEKFTQKKVFKFSKLDHLILVCGHYEGFDERIKQCLIDESISIGDYILTGGEIPAMVISDAVVRLIPNVIKNEATQFESFSKLNDQSKSILLEYPQYTKPDIYEGFKVPEILLSGDHAKIRKWRQEQAVAVTKKQRPDLLK